METFWPESFQGSKISRWKLPLVSWTYDCVGFQKFPSFQKKVSGNHGNFESLKVSKKFPVFGQSCLRLELSPNTRRRADLFSPVEFFGAAPFYFAAKPSPPRTKPQARIRRSAPVTEVQDPMTVKLCSSENLNIFDRREAPRGIPSARCTRPRPRAWDQSRLGRSPPRRTQDR
jgi:hypothetical protein